MLLDVCSDTRLLTVMILFRRTLELLQLIAPIGLIIFATIDILRAIIAQDQDQMKKKTKSIPKRALAAILIYLVPSFIDLVMGIVSEDFEYASCFENATQEYVVDARKNIASERVLRAEETKRRADYEDALLAVNQLEDGALKTTLLNRLKVVKDNFPKEETPSASNPPSNGGNGNDGDTPKGPSQGGVENKVNAPYYNQYDWRNVKYKPGVSDSKTIRSSGCGYCSLAMVASGFNGKDTSINPETVLRFIYPNISSNYGAIEDQALYDSRVLNKYNLNAYVLFERSSGLSKNDKISKVQNAINQGKAVIILKEGHFFPIFPNGDGKVVLLDSGKRANNGTYTVEGIWNKMGTFKYAVAYSRK